MTGRETRACPLCGAPLNWREQAKQRRPWERSADQSGWERQEWRSLGAGVVGEAVKAGASYERRRPVRAAALESDVVVPVAQSVISGIVTGMMAGAGAGIAGLGRPWLWAVAASAGGLGVAWVVILREHRAGLWEVERILGRDVDGDGVVGRPPAMQEPVQVEVQRRDSRGRLRMMWFGNLPERITVAQLEGLARAVERGQEFSRRGLPDGLFSPDEYSALVDKMLEGGLLRYQGKGPRSGVELTGPGRAFLRRFLEPGN